MIVGEGKKKSSHLTKRQENQPCHPFPFVRVVIAVCT